MTVANRALRTVARGLVLTGALWLAACGGASTPAALPTVAAPTSAPSQPTPEAVTPKATLIPTGWNPRQLTTSLAGSGASFPNPLYQVWISVYTKNVVPGVQLSYASVGSGQGKKDFLAGLTDFGATDSPISSDDTSPAALDALHLPTAIGGVMPMARIDGVATALNYTPEILEGIFLGTITNWSDPAIARENPAVALPDLAITPVYRSDSSGTTAIWTDYLSKVSPTWKEKVGAGSAVSFPAGIGASGNAGIAATVLNTNGAVGYVEVGYALASNMPLPALKNASGAFVKPDSANVSAAASAVEIPSDPKRLAMSITNSSAPDAYPVAAFTYILIRQTGSTDMTKAQATADFVYWGLSVGQNATEKLGYSPLPDAMRQAAMKALTTMTVAGAPVIEAPSK